MTLIMTTASKDAAPFRPVVEIDLDAVAANWRKLDMLSGAAEAGAVVKADAYGLGADSIGRRLAAEGCRTFFVAYDFEAAALRNSVGPHARIFVLNGPDPASLEACLSANAVPVLNTMGQAEQWRGTGRQAALMIDTGMNRLGIRPSQVAEFKASFSELDLQFVMSHLACSEDAAHPMNARQLAAFREAASAWPDTPRSFANTGGICLGPDYAFDLTRPGVGIYGALSLPGFSPEPVARLTAPLISVFVLSDEDPEIARASVGYSGTAPVHAGQRIGTVAYGYADGALRSLSNMGFAVVRETKIPIIGRISMDLIALDLSAAPLDVQTGDRVEIFGPAMSIEDQARHGGTIAYELLTSIGRRTVRHYQGASGPTAFQDS